MSLVFLFFFFLYLFLKEAGHWTEPTNSVAVRARATPTSSAFALVSLTTEGLQSQTTSIDCYLGNQNDLVLTLGIDFQIFVTCITAMFVILLCQIAPRLRYLNLF